MNVANLGDNDFWLSSREKKTSAALPKPGHAWHQARAKKKNAPAGNTNRGAQDNGEGYIPLLKMTLLRS